MVGWFIEQQQVRRFEKKSTQSDTTPLTTGELGYVGVGRRQTQRVHCDLECAVEVPGVGGIDLVLQLCLFFEQRIEVGIGFAHGGADFVVTGDHGHGLAHAFRDVFENVLAGVEVGLLLQKTNSEAGRKASFAGEAVIQAGHDLQ